MHRNYVILHEGSHQIAVDTEFIQEFTTYIKSHNGIRKKVTQHQAYLADGHWRTEYFEKESPNPSVSDIYVWKIRITVAGRKINDRLICKVLDIDGAKKRVVIIGGLFQGKKSNAIPPKQLTLMEKISSYVYQEAK